MNHYKIYNGYISIEQGINGVSLIPEKFKPNKTVIKVPKCINFSERVYIDNMDHNIIRLNYEDDKVMIINLVHRSVKLMIEDQYELVTARSKDGKIIYVEDISNHHYIKDHKYNPLSQKQSIRHTMNDCIVENNQMIYHKYSKAFIEIGIGRYDFKTNSYLISLIDASTINDLSKLSNGDFRILYIPKHYKYLCCIMNMDKDLNVKSVMKLPRSQNASVYKSFVYNDYLLIISQIRNHFYAWLINGNNKIIYSHKKINRDNLMEAYNFKITRDMIFILKFGRLVIYDLYFNMLFNLKLDNPVFGMNVFNNALVIKYVGNRVSSIDFNIMIKSSKVFMAFMNGTTKSNQDSAIYRFVKNPLFDYHLLNIILDYTPTFSNIH
jgi:hypothetical protein